MWISWPSIHLTLFSSLHPWQRVCLVLMILPYLRGVYTSSHLFLVPFLILSTFIPPLCSLLAKALLCMPGVLPYCCLSLSNFTILLSLRWQRRASISSDLFYIILQRSQKAHAKQLGLCCTWVRIGLCLV